MGGGQPTTPNQPANTHTHRPLTLPVYMSYCRCTTSEIQDGDRRSTRQHLVWSNWSSTIGTGGGLSSTDTLIRPTYLLAELASHVKKLMFANCLVLSLLNVPTAQHTIPLFLSFPLSLGNELPSTWLPTNPSPRHPPKKNRTKHLLQHP